MLIKPLRKKLMITTYGNCDIWAESARSVIKDAMNRLVEELCSWSCVLPSFPYSSLLNESCSLMTSSSLPLLSPFPSLCRASSHNPRGDAGEREAACPVWWSASLRETLTANHLSSSGILLGFTFQRGAISYIPAWRAVSCLEWTGGFSLPWHAAGKWLW